MTLIPTPTLTLAELCDLPPPPGPGDWNPTGVVIARGLLDNPVLGGYEEEWRAVHGSPGSPGCNWPGWLDCTPYERHPALRRLCCDPRIAALLQSTTGEPMAVSLNLTPWVSTERDWHQDQYLNPPEVGDRYAAVWVALQDVHPDSGPFQFVAGSHRWPQISQSKLRRRLSPVENDDPLWPRHAERILTHLFEEEIEEQDAPIITYLPERGDVLVWHPRLLHRGSRARIPGMERRALIAHYSALDRADMPLAPVQHEAGGWFFPWPT